MINKTNFSPLFKALREQLAMDQYELADRLGVGQSTISKIEAGWADPSINTFVGAYRLAKTHKLAVLVGFDHVLSS